MKRALIALIFLPCPIEILAAVTNIQSRATSGVQEFLHGNPGTASSEKAEGDPRDDDALIRALAEVETVELGGVLVGQARVTANAGDPTPLISSNPAELSLEAGCFSNTDSVSYLVTSSVEESRTILLRRNEIPANGSAESLFTLSGAIVVWALDSTTSLESIEGSIEARIVDVNEEPLFETTLNIRPESDDGLEIHGNLRLQEVSLDQLADLGVDDASLDILEQVQDSGRLMVFTIPLQQHRYRYAASANQSFTLTASLEIRLQNTPGGTGIAVVLGRPFAELAEFIGSGLPGVIGDNVQKAVNQAVSDASKASNSPQDTNANRVCGVLGTEVMLLFMPFALSLVRRSRILLTRIQSASLTREGDPRAIAVEESQIEGTTNGTPADRRRAS